MEYTQFAKLTIGEKFLYISSWGEELTYEKISVKKAKDVITEEIQHFSKYDIIFIFPKQEIKK